MPRQIECFSEALARTMRRLQRRRAVVISLALAGGLALASRWPAASLPRRSPRWPRHRRTFASIRSKP